MSGFMSLFNDLAGTKFGQGDGIVGAVNNIGSFARLKQMNPGDPSIDYQYAGQPPQQQQQNLQQLQQQPQTQPEQQANPYGNGLMQLIMASIAKQQGNNNGH